MNFNININFNLLLLHTAFCCMACDGVIAPEEVNLIKNMSNKNNKFGNINIEDTLDRLVDEINKKGKGLLKEYICEIKSQNLTKKQELEILEVAYETINADNKVEYSEIKFFKIIRFSLNDISDDDILENIKGIDEIYLSQDIKSSYFQLYEDYFENINFNEFKIGDNN